MKKLLTPSVQNREACLVQLWDRLRIDDLDEAALASDFAWIDRSCQERSSAKAGLSASRLARRYLELALRARRRSEFAVGDGLLRKSFAFAVWARELNHVARQSQEWPEQVGDDLLMTIVAWQAMSTACGSPWFALWVAPHLHNQFGHPDPAMPLVYYSYDSAARGFMTVLQRVLVTRVWPERIEQGELSAYGTLLQACRSSVADWSAALVDYCDWRTANAYGYAEMGAAKRRRQSAMASVLDAECIEQVFPLELLTVRFAFEHATGGRLSLDAPHPMLQAPWLTQPFPSVEPLHEDDWTTRLQALRHNAGRPQLPLRCPDIAKYL